MRASYLKEYVEVGCLYITAGKELEPCNLVITHINLQLFSCLPKNITTC
jgi:hypothetical protein